MSKISMIRIDNLDEDNFLITQIFLYDLPLNDATTNTFIKSRAIEYILVTKRSQIPLFNLLD